jgi:short-subunit dehydrogenase
VSLPRARSAIVTGASSGIGTALAIELAGKGYRLGLVGRHEQRLTETVGSCLAAGAAGCEIGAFDIRDADAFTAFVAGFGDIDLYISNAGILDGRREGEVVESRGVARTVLDINLIACVEGLHTVLDAMRARGRGQITLVTSLAGLSPLPDAPAYSASKAGLVSYGIALRDALEGTGIGVTVACPGYVATPMGAQHVGNRPFEVTAADAAHRIVRAALKNRALCGFPFPLHPAAHLTLMLPDCMRRLFTKGVRFTVGSG